MVQTTPRPGIPSLDTPAIDAVASVIMAQIGPLLFIIWTGIHTVLRRRSVTGEIVDHRPATRSEIRAAAQSLDWQALVLQHASVIRPDGVLAIGGWLFSRVERDGRYVYQGDPGGDPWQIEECDWRKPSEWIADLTGCDPDGEAPTPGYLHLADGTVATIDPSKIPF